MTSEATQVGSGPVQGRIVVGVDGSAPSKAALAWAVRQAELTGAAIDVVTTWAYPMYLGVGVVWPNDFDPQAIARGLVEASIAEVVGADSHVVIHTHLRGDMAAAWALVQAAEGADLLVVGSSGHGEFAGMLLGSVSLHCATHAPCPVVIVRPTT